MPPIQKAEKLPAIRPLRMLSDAPPSLLASTISRTWRLLVAGEDLVNSGMIAPASVPQVMIVESFHQIWRRQGRRSAGRRRGRSWRWR